MQTLWQLPVDDALGVAGSLLSSLLLLVVVGVYLYSRKRSRDLFEKIHR
jgi:hypothetical protein